MPGCLSMTGVKIDDIMPTVRKAKNKCCFLKFTFLIPTRYIRSMKMKNVIEFPNTENAGKAKKKMNIFNLD